MTGVIHPYFSFHVMSIFKNNLPQEGTAALSRGESLPELSSGCPSYSGEGKNCSESVMGLYSCREPITITLSSSNKRSVTKWQSVLGENKDNSNFNSHPKSSQEQFIQSNSSKRKRQRLRSRLKRKHQRVPSDACNDPGSFQSVTSALSLFENSQNIPLASAPSSVQHKSKIFTPSMMFKESFNYKPSEELDSQPQSSVRSESTKRKRCRSRRRSKKLKKPVTEVVYDANAETLLSKCVIATSTKPEFSPNVLTTTTSVDSFHSLRSESIPSLLSIEVTRPNLIEPRQSVLRNFEWLLGYTIPSQSVSVNRASNVPFQASGISGISSNEEEVLWPRSTVEKDRILLNRRFSRREHNFMY